MALNDPLEQRKASDKVVRLAVIKGLESDASTLSLREIVVQRKEYLNHLNIRRKNTCG